MVYRKGDANFLFGPAFSGLFGAAAVFLTEVLPQRRRLGLYLESGFFWDILVNG